MPEMDGFEATAEIRKREQAAGARRLPIIALTANAMAQDRDECLNAGMDDHLAKPFSMQTIQEVLDRWMPETPARPAGLPLQMKHGEADEVLELKVLEQLAALRVNGKPELLARTISLYLVESPKLMERLKQAANANDATEIVRCAHSLKSSSANIGATALSRYCSEIEGSARRADAEDARRLVVRIEKEHDRVQSALSAQYEVLTAGHA
jgi:HPt (histidine-containing phosphotransfer) domain-containing protein